MGQGWVQGCALGLRSPGFGIDKPGSYREGEIFRSGDDFAGPCFIVGKPVFVQCGYPLVPSPTLDSFPNFY